LGVRLAKTAFRLAYNLGVRFEMMCCHPRLLGFFTRLGYRQTLPKFYLEDYDEACPLVLVLADARYLKQVGSPFLSVLPSIVEDHGSVDFFYEHICEPSAARQALETTR
jgi:hypothetical protein